MADGTAVGSKDNFFAYNYNYDWKEHYLVGLSGVRDWFVPLSGKDLKKQKSEKIRKSITFGICINFFGAIAMLAWYLVLAVPLEIGAIPLVCVFEFPMFLIFINLFLVKYRICTIQLFVTSVQAIVVFTCGIVLFISGGFKSPLNAALVPIVSCWGILVSAKNAFIFAFGSFALLVVAHEIGFVVDWLIEDLRVTMMAVELLIAMVLQLCTSLYNEREIMLREKDLKDAAQASEKANLTKSSFLATMSHEMRTPLHHVTLVNSIILGHLQDKLKRSKTLKHDRDFFKFLEDLMTKSLGSSKFLMSLINDVLDMSKIEVGKLRVHLEKMNMIQALDEVVSMFHNAAEEHQIDFRFTSSESFRNLMVLADPIRVKQILYNLLSNAFKFTDNEGLVHVSIGWIATDDDYYSLQSSATPKVSTNREVSSIEKSSSSTSVLNSPPTSKSTLTESSTPLPSPSSFLSNTIPKLDLPSSPPIQKPSSEDVADTAGVFLGKPNHKSPSSISASVSLGNANNFSNNFEPIPQNPANATANEMKVKSCALIEAEYNLVNDLNVSQVVDFPRVPSAHDVSDVLHSEDSTLTTSSLVCLDENAKGNLTTMNKKKLCETVVKGKEEEITTITVVSRTDSTYPVSSPVTLNPSELESKSSYLPKYSLSNPSILNESAVDCRSINNLSLLNGADKDKNLEKMMTKNSLGKKRQTTSRFKKTAGEEENKVMSSEGTFIITVKDSGIGIPPQEIDKLFQPFYQIAESRTKRKYQGTGLGLAISKHLADEMNIKIGITKDVMVGTEFTLTCEGYIDNDFCDESIEKHKKKKVKKNDMFRDIKILICDDNLISSQLLVKFIERSCKTLKVDYVISGEDALQYVDKESPDILLLDLYMPGLNGFQVAERIRQSELNSDSHLQIVALSATSLAEDKEQSMETMDCFMSKPFNNDSLIKVLKECVENIKERKANV